MKIRSIFRQFCQCLVGFGMLEKEVKEPKRAVQQTESYYASQVKSLVRRFSEELSFMIEQFYESNISRQARAKLHDCKTLSEKVGETINFVRKLLQAVELTQTTP